MESLSISLSRRDLWKVERLWEILLVEENSLLISMLNALHLLSRSRETAGGCHVEGIFNFVGGVSFGSCPAQKLFRWSWRINCSDEAMASRLDSVFTGVGT